MRCNPVMLVLGLVLSVAAAGCDGGDGGPAPLPTPSVSASFPPHGLADVIAIDAAERLPLRRATLIAPDGTATPADSIDVSERPSLASAPPIAGGLTGGSGLSELALPGPIGPPAIRSEGRVLITLSKASIALPDPVAYRRNWARYRVRLEFGTPPGAVETREIAAPEPPPAAG